MSIAIIRVSKKVLVNHLVKDSNLKQLYESMADSLSYTLSMHRVETFHQLKMIQPKSSQQLSIEASTTCTGYLRMFKRSIPEEFANDIDKNFKIEFCNVDIIDFDIKDINSLNLLIYFITEEFTFLERVGNKMLLVEGDRSSELLAGKQIEKTFFYEFDEAVDINYYRRVI